MMIERPMRICSPMKITVLNDILKIDLYILFQICNIRGQGKKNLCTEGLIRLHFN